MDNQTERRATGQTRVPVQALVEICGRDVGGAPAFEAESVDVSGRGMHVRTAYLPEVGSPLVCRFENEGQEIVVEGVVAWRSEEERGGEFGIQFTALDSGSVEALRDLCGVGQAAQPEPEQTETAKSESPPEAGKRVRLHIDGLGAPMKASVRSGGSRQMHVASNLEFLKVGRHLEIEDVAQGARRGAQIDSVDVVIDPSSQVPQLVVALRFDGAEESTPEPSVIDSEDAEDFGQPARRAAAGIGQIAQASTDADGSLGEDDFVEPEDAEAVIEEAAAMRGKVASFAVDAGSYAKKGGVVMAHASAKAAAGIGRFFKGAGAKVQELRKQKARAEAPKRTTAPPPSGVLSAAGRRLRPQSAVADAEPTDEPRVDPTSKKKRVKKIAAASAVVVLLMTVGVIAMKKPASPPGADASKEAPAAVAVAANPTGDVTKVDEQGNPVVDDNAAAATPAQAGSGAAADVPLFGPTPMATMEPAPLGPAPGADEGSDEEPKDDEAREKAAASASVEDQVFGDAAGDDEDKDREEKKPVGSTGPWGNGKVHEPTIHRLRLDKAGTVIQGAANATGFTVVLPGVKVMESAKGIERRDSRIARVKTRNGTTGAEISFQFKDGIPGYRVRLKKDYVEFLISAPKKGDKAVASTGGSKKSSKKATKKSGRADSKAKKASTSSKKKKSKKAAKSKTKKKDG